MWNNTAAASNPYLVLGSMAEAEDPWGPGM